MCDVLAKHWDLSASQLAAKGGEFLIIFTSLKEHSFYDFYNTIVLSRAINFKQLHVLAL